jgi:hypothetical protein
MGETSLGEIAYTEYCQSAGGVSAVSGTPLPTWEDQRQDIREHWEAAANLVAQEVVCRRAR